jgi:hypothetical protein
MKLKVILRPNSEHASFVYGFVRDLQMRTGKSVELVNIDSKDGYVFANLYDVVQYPCILVVSDSGEMQQMWQGSTLPLIDEVVSYL